MMWLLPWLFLAAVFVTAFIVSRVLLFLFLSNLPIEKRTATAFAKDWSTIGAFVLGGWFIVSVATGSSYPLVVAATTFIVGGALLLSTHRVMRNEPHTRRNPLSRFLIIWLGGAILSGLIAYAILGAFALIIMAPDL